MEDIYPLLAFEKTIVDLQDQNKILLKTISIHWDSKISKIIAAE